MVFKTQGMDLEAVLTDNIFSNLFSTNLKLVPQLSEVYELELAYYESRVLSEEEIIKNGAYFSRVGERFTRHFLMCNGEPIRLPEYSSSRLKLFFKTNQFKTGYATHGLFPYRGKFHPQMIKGLINIMDIKEGDTILDPMMGSGTVLIEASLMGIKSIGIDVSPFCRFMVQCKLNGLTLPINLLKRSIINKASLYEYFKAKVGQPQSGAKMRDIYNNNDNLFSMLESNEHYCGVDNDCLANPVIHDFLLLAYLDSAGYSERSDKKAPYEQFCSILERYVFVAEKIQEVLSGLEHELGEAKAMEGDAREMPIDGNSIDGIIFSPPYSFAIDYLANDSFHLNYFGVNIEKLRDRMVGLRGVTLKQKLDIYKTDMNKILSECSRVLRMGKICTVIVGTNSNQISKVYGKPSEEIQGIDEMIVELGLLYGLHLIKRIGRQITGMANTMRSEYILMLQKR